MKLRDIISTSNTNLLRSKLRTFLTVLAIFVGALTLTLTTAIGEGVKDYIDKQTQAISFKDTLTVIPGSFGEGSNPVGGVVEYNPDQQISVNVSFLTTNDVDAIKKVDGVEDVTLVFAPKALYVTREGQKKFKDDTLDIYTRNLELPLAAGKQANLENKNEMILAYKYLEPLGFKNPQDAVGKKVEYVFKKASGEERKESLDIVGVQVNTLAGSQNRINMKLAEDVYRFQFGSIDASPGALAFLKKDTSQSKQDEIKRELTKKGYTAITFEDQVKTLKDFINILQVAVNAFGIIVIVAAAIGIINTLLMAVYERTREIGLMKALGAKGGEIFLMFALEAVSLGFWGGILGALVAFIIGTVLNPLASGSFLKGFEGFNLFLFPPLAIAPIILGTMIVGLLAGTLPAIKASRLNPIEALRYE